MKLYTFARAPNPRRVHWLMAEKGVTDLETVEVDIMAGEHKSPGFRERAGFAHIPALELRDGTVITESLAICRYLEALYPDPNLFGRTLEEATIIEMWTRRCEIYLANPLMMAVRHAHPALAALEAPVPEVGSYNLAMAERFMRALERQLDGKSYIAADRLTMADIVTAVGVDFARMIRYRPPAELARFSTWLAAMRERPGFSAGA